MVHCVHASGPFMAALGRPLYVCPVVSIFLSIYLSFFLVSFLFPLSLAKGNYFEDWLAESINKMLLTTTFIVSSHFHLPCSRLHSYLIPSYRNEWAISTFFVLMKSTDEPFLQRAAMLAAMLALQALYYLWQFRPSVCPSVCSSVRPSHAGIVSKRRHVARCSLHCQIAKCVSYCRNQKNI